jgi:uncharacterized protein (UPF0332 family)
LLINNITAKTHSGVKNRFFHEFIQTDLIDKEFSRLFSDPQDRRHESDYADFIEFDKETVEPLPMKVKHLSRLLRIYYKYQ